MKNLFIFSLCLLTVSLSAAQIPGNEYPPVVKERIVKLDFFAPLTGNLTLGYEQTLLNSITFDGELGIIGVSVINDGYHPAGVFLKGGTKLYFSPDYMMEGMKRYNDFQGAYFKPEIIYSGFAFDYERLNSTTGFYYTDRGSNHSFAFMLNLGKQWVIAKMVSLEVYGGIGYGFSSVNAEDGQYIFPYDANSIVPYKYSHVQVSSDLPLAFSCGLNLGLLLK